MNLSPELDTRPNPVEIDGATFSTPTTKQGGIHDFSFSEEGFPSTPEDSEEGTSLLLKRETPAPQSPAHRRDPTLHKHGRGTAAKYDFTLKQKQSEWFRFGMLLATASTLTAGLSVPMILTGLNYAVPYVTTTMATYQIAATSQLVAGVVFGVIASFCLIGAIYSFYKSHSLGQQEAKSAASLDDGRTTGRPMSYVRV